MIVTGRICYETCEGEGWLQVEDGTIVESGAGVPATTPDFEAAWIAPGFVDLQVNGGCGVEVTDGTHALSRIDAGLLDSGVTSYLATIMTTDEYTAAATLEAVAGHRSAGPTPLAGVHLEGPFLSPKQPGVHRIALMRVPESGVPSYVFHPEVRLVTLAPELPGAINLIRRLTAGGVVVALGHSAATAMDGTAAAAAGATMVTHLFNAMPSFHHRAPGLAGWAVATSDLALGVIADGAHVHPDALRLVLLAAGDRVVLVSDASVAALAPPGRYVQAGVDVERHQDGTVTTLEGGLAGSGITVADAVRYSIRALGTSRPDALRAATWRPASLLGKRELLSPGADADMVLMDSNLEVQQVIFRGSVLRD